MSGLEHLQPEMGNLPDADWHKYEDCNRIVNEPLINDLLERTKEQVRNP